jgi:hypothetical protein
MQPTRFSEVIHSFVVTKEAQGKIAHWIEYRNPDAVEWARGYAHEYPSLSEVNAVIEKVQKRPLGEGTRRDDELPTMRPETEWPLSFLFHRLRASSNGGRIPGPNQFWEHLQSSENQEKYYLPTMAKGTDLGFSTERIVKAMRWRAMNAWMSFIREMHLIATLQEWGFPARFHPAVDANLYVDCWVGKHLYMVMSGNSKIAQRDRAHGRPELYFPVPPYTVHRLSAKEGDANAIWLIADETIDIALGALAPHV